MVRRREGKRGVRIGGRGKEEGKEKEERRERIEEEKKEGVRKWK